MAEVKGEIIVRISENFGGKYLTGKALAAKVPLGRDVPVTIRRVVEEETYNTFTRSKEMVWVVYFEGKDKGLILKATNARKLADMLGDETDDWIGKRVAMYLEMVHSPRGRTEGIRFRAVAQSGSSQSGSSSDGGVHPEEKLWESQLEESPTVEELRENHDPVGVEMGDEEGLPF